MYERLTHVKIPGAETTVIVFIHSFCPLTTAAYHFQTAAPSFKSSSSSSSFN